MVRWAFSAGRVVFVVFAGALLSLAHPFRTEDLLITPNVLTFLMATAGLCLFISLSAQPQRGLIRFFYGVIGGLGFFCITLYWISDALEIFGNISAPIALGAMLLLSLYCSLFMGFWAYLAGHKWVKLKPPVVRLWMWASAWAGLEAIRQWLMTGFPWGELGFSFSFAPWIGMTASIWGAHGLTFLWVFFASLLIKMDHWIKDRDNLKPLAYSLAGILAFGLIFTFIPWRFNAETMALKIGLVQPNVAQDEKWSPELAQRNFSDLLRLTEEAITSGAEIVVWPETAYPGLLGANQTQFPLSSQIPVIVGAVVRDRGTNRNSALLLENDQLKARFDKIQLVPFGEYVPLADLVPFGKLVANAGDFISGSWDQDPLRPEEGKLHLGPLICYEDIFSRLSVRHAHSGVNLLVNMTNDAWYGESSAQLQHAAMAQFQVWQTWIPMVRATNNGQTSFITPTLRRDIPPYSQSVAVETMEVPVKSPRTFFSWTYPLMEWIWWLIFAIGLLWKDHPQTRRIFFQRSRL